MNISWELRGYVEYQADNAARIAMIQPGGAFDSVVSDITEYALRQATGIVHVRTGALRGALRGEARGLTGKLQIDPSATNPISKARPIDYGPIEEARGGSHAFFTRTVEPTSEYARGRLAAFGAQLAR